MRQRREEFVLSPICIGEIGSNNSQALFKLSSFRNVTSNLGRPDDRSRVVTDWRYSDRHVDLSSGLCSLNGVEMIDTLAGTDSGDDGIFLGQSLRRNHQ